MGDFLFHGDYGMAPTNFGLMAMGVLLAFACGLSVATAYMVTHTGLSYSRSYVGTLILMPVLVTLVMMILSNNLVMAFGLMAIFAMVRFRSILRDTLDTAYVLSVIVIGLGCGTLKFSSAILGCLATLLFMLFYWGTQFGTRHRYNLILNIHWQHSATDLGTLTQVLHRHGRNIQCASQRFGDEEDGLHLSYRLLLRDPNRSNELLSELKALEGVASLSGTSAKDESEI